MALTVMDFYADWCGPCDQQEPILEALDDDYGDRVTVERIDVDASAERANEYDVRSLPTIIVVDGDDIIDRFVGVQSEETLSTTLDAAL